MIEGHVYFEFLLLACPSVDGSQAAKVVNSAVNYLRKDGAGRKLAFSHVYGRKAELCR